MDSRGADTKVLLLLCTAFFMAMLDSSIVLVALPSVDSDLSFSASGLQWVMSAYMLSFGGLLLLGGRASDRLGQRRMFMVGVALFGLASLAAGFAVSAGTLVAARAVQGVAAAIMVPAAQSILMTTFQEGPARNKALGFWTSTGAIGGTVGWLIGGPITDGLGWEWIFFLNVPVAAGVVALSLGVLDRAPAEPGRRGSFDFAGAALVTVGMTVLVYAVVEAPEVGWGSGRTVGLLAAALALIATFLVTESRSRSPLVPLRVFRSTTLLGGCLVLMMLGMMAFGLPFVLTQYAQKVLGWSPIQFGLAFVVSPVLIAVGSAIGQAAVGRGGVRPVAVAGMTLTGLGCLLLTRISLAGGYIGEIFPALVVFGFGLGLTYVAGSISSLAGVPERDAGLASGLNNAFFQIGGATGVAILSSVMVSDRHGGLRLALTTGCRSAFAVAIAFAGIGLAVAVVLMRERHGRSTSAVETEASRT